ncbi:MAG TPA: hypothetical protein VFF98_01865 [Novosphingobium sp.]|nr:hypothetical protein [Novosphingobium sp.]HZV10815.1 hypothetical protein [Novosphingobium sp.]
MLARLPRPLLLLITLAILAISAWCLTIKPPPIRVAKKGGYTDVHLYKDITEGMRQGQTYYQAAVATQRAHHYPLKPFITVRPPTLVWLAAHLGWRGVDAIAGVLVFIAALCWFGASEIGLSFAERLGITTVVAGASAHAVFSTVLIALHEYLAGICIALALAGVFAGKHRWGLPLLAAALGLAVRELVLPFVLLALAFALVERRWREAAAWGALVATFGLAMAFHAQAVNALVLPGDITSPGWHAGQGFSAFLKAVIYTSYLAPLPQPVALLMAMLPMVGWLALDGRRGAFCCLLVAGYAVMIAFFSRADTFYWGAIMLPWYFIGYVLLPRAVLQLWGVARGKPGSFVIGKKPASL